MKLQELESRTKTQQSLKVFESHFGQRLAIDAITIGQAQTMLKRVRGLIREYRETSSFHRSERNPAYLKLVVMERALEGRVKESQPGAVASMGQTDAMDPKAAQATASGVRKVAAATGQGAQANLLGKAIDTAVKGKALDPRQRGVLGQQLGGLQKAMSDPATATRLQQMLKTATQAESKRAKGRRLREASDLQQAQVVLAAQDMVDQIQKMIEQVSAMQFKDLPALVDSIRNDVGMDQAQQFNNDVTSALQGLIQGLQGSKTQLETAQGVLTGQAPVVPGQDAGAAAPALPGGNLPGADTGEVDMSADLDLDANLPSDDDEEIPAKALGRERR